MGSSSLMWANASGLQPPDLQCSDTAAGRSVLTAASFAYALVTAPLSASVLYAGLRRPGSLGAVTSYSDFFTYNMAAVELVAAGGFVFTYCYGYSGRPDSSSLGVLIVSFIWPGQTLFPVLLCVERYLAAVHPVTYRGLRRAGGVLLRNLSTGCVWLGCCAWLVLLTQLNVPSSYRRVVGAFVLIASLAVMMFCSLSVLRILVRPRPGSGGGGRAQPSQSTRRAVAIVLVVMVVLWFKFGGNVMVIVTRFSPSLAVRCVGEAATFVFYLPCGVVLPLLGLHRAGRLPNFKHASGSA